MSVINIEKNQDNCKNGIIINYSVSYGNQPQPLFEAGSPNISCVVQIENMAQISISTAIFREDENSQTDDISSLNLANVPSMTIVNAVIGVSYQASSGQAYTVKSLQITGQKE